MSKSIYDRATSYTNDIEWWCDKACDWLGQDISERNEDYDIDNKIDEIRKALEQAQKQEKLLELYRELINAKDDMLDTCEVVDDIYYDMREIEVYLKQRIKELENDK